MAAREKRVWTAEDGEEFDTKAEADRHDEIQAARKELEEAQEKAGRLLAESLTTVDGVRFEFRRRAYYYLAPGWFAMPEVREVRFWNWNLQFEEGDKGLAVLQREGDGKLTPYPVRELYADRDKADQAGVVACEAWLAERAAEVAEQRAKVFPAPLGGG